MTIFLCFADMGSPPRREETCLFRDRCLVTGLHATIIIIIIMDNDSSNNRSMDSSVGIAMGYGLDSKGSIPDGGKRFFSTPQRPGRLWNPPIPDI
jgi:hypothetical protein